MTLMMRETKLRVQAAALLLSNRWLLSSIEEARFSTISARIINSTANNAVRMPYILNTDTRV